MCGGRVVVPGVWNGIYPPTPHCESCGAFKKESHGPVVDMERERGPLVKETWTVGEISWSGQYGDGD